MSREKEFIAQSYRLWPPLKDVCCSVGQHLSDFEVVKVHGAGAGGRSRDYTGSGVRDSFGI